MAWFLTSKDYSLGRGIKYKQIKCDQVLYMPRDFPGGLVVKNPPSNAGAVGSTPGWGTKIPHAAGQLRLHALERSRVLQLRPDAAK